MRYEDDYYDFAEPERFFDEQDWDRLYAIKHAFVPQERFPEFCGSWDTYDGDMCGLHVSKHYNG